MFSGVATLGAQRDTRGMSLCSYVSFQAEKVVHDVVMRIQEGAQRCVVGAPGDCIDRTARMHANFSNHNNAFCRGF